MAKKWMALNVRMRNSEDIKRARDLELSEDTIEEMYKTVVINLDKVMVYCPSYDKHGEDTGGSELTFENGYELVTDVPFSEIDKILRDE